VKHPALIFTGVLVTLSCIVIFTRAFVGVLDGNSALITEGVKRLPLAVLLYGGSFLAFAGSWHFALRSVGGQLRLAENSAILATTQFAKYIPGNVAHHAGRAAMTAQKGIKVERVALAMTIEIILLIAICALLALPVVGGLAAVLSLDLMARPMQLGGIGIVVVALAVLGFVLLRSSRFAPRLEAAVLRIKTLKISQPLNLIWTSLFVALGLVSATLSLVATDRDPTDFGWMQFAFVLSVFSAAFILGLITPGAPSGIGVREVVLMEGLAPVMDQNEAVAAALLFRVATFCGDLIIFLVGLVMLWIQRTPDGDAEEDREA